MYQEVLDRIQSYLGNGGLFNPELMEHDKVRALILDARDALEARELERSKWERSCHEWSRREMDATARFNELRHAAADYLAVSRIGAPADRLEKARLRLETLSS